MRHRAIAAMITCAGAACAPQRGAAPSVAEARAGVPIYEGTVAIDPAARSLRARWHIELVRTPTMADSATLLLNTGLVVSSITGPDVARHTESIRSDNKAVTIHFSHGLDATARPTRIDIAYEGTPAFGSDSINGMSPRWVELGLDSFWQPVFEDFAQRIMARVRVVMPPAWTAAFSGSIASAGDTLILMSTVPQIDIAFSASPALRFAERGRVRVYYVGEPPPAADPVLRTTALCAAYLDARYGARDSLPAVRMVIAPRTGPGYARKNYVVITGGADTATVPMQRFVCHELAHYWSSGAISSGPDNWLNEGFAEFVSARYVRDASGVAAYDGIVQRWQQQASNAGSVWTAQATTRPSARVSYGKAPLLLHRLEQRVGSDVMDRLLARYMTERIRTTPALVDMIGNTAGRETAVWFRDELAR